MRVYPYTLMTNGVVANSPTSSVLQLKNMFGAAIECVVTSAAGLTATLELHGSASGNNYQELTGQSFSVTGNGTFIFDVTQTSMQYLKVLCDRDAGSGTLNIVAYSKGF